MITDADFLFFLRKIPILAALRLQKCMLIVIIIFYFRVHFAIEKGVDFFVFFIACCYAFVLLERQNFLFHDETNALSSAEAPAGYPYNNSNNRKKQKARGERREEGKGGSSLLSFSFPSCPARCLFLSPQPPHDTKRPLRRREKPTQNFVLRCWYTNQAFQCNSPLCFQ